MFAVGTFKGGRISCYSEDTGDERLLELELGTRGASVDGQGITQVRLDKSETYSRKARPNAMGSVALHPFQPWILTAHGSRKPSLFEKSLENQSDSESETDSSEEDESSSSDEDSGEESEASTAGELEHDVPRELVAKQSGRTNGDALAEHKGPGATPLRDPPALPKGGWIGAIEIGQLY
ncbi:hypothetical protein QFC19_000128 [Naganishia cerealis]|uniref:Uncharacterized protein n=1 Tax=Naganishia cerealis TaxID=610337 RepID=A0ACC2WQ84_9TREE|nr:hypothetical protein QFC19_000128 [Naganishia cerealis]